MKVRAAAEANHLPGEVGIWIIVLGDMMIFALFFSVFIYYRSQDLSVFDESSKSLNQSLGILNTVLLLTSSWFVAIGVHVARHGVSNRWWFLAGILCGAGFVIDKVIEYHEKLASGISITSNDFFMFYFILTGIHLFHVIIGLGVLGYMWRLTAAASNAPSKIAVLESGATFWHLVDLLWIVLFPLLYLMK